MERRDCLRLALGSAAGFALAAVPGSALAQPAAIIFALRNPGCGCCGGWADHLRDHGYEVHLHDSADLSAVKDRLGIPQDLRSCHTAIVEGYRVEGHVPAEFVTKLLAERPSVSGIAVAGMPIGSPGMEGADPEAYDVMAFDVEGGETRVFGSVRP